MKRQVSRVTESLPCTSCGREPRRSGQRWGNNCFAEYMRHRRAGRTEMQLTPAERELVLAMRAKPAGKHHAA